MELCNWLSEHGSDTVLLNISSAVYNSPTENQIYEIKAQLPDCPLTPAPAPAKSLPAHSRAASMVSCVWACGRKVDPWHATPSGPYAVCLEANNDASCIRPALLALGAQDTLIRPQMWPVGMLIIFSRCVDMCVRVLKPDCLAQISLSPAVAIRSSIPMKEAAPLTGNPDHDWAIAMVAHHQVRQAFLSP